MGDKQVPDGNQNQAPIGTESQSLGWRAALPSDLKEHDFVKTFAKPGDFVKSALEIKTERDALNTKLANAIFKPDEKATPEQIAEFHKALGVPEKPTDYEFPKGEGVEHDPKMIDWAKDIFHKAKLSKEQGATISQAWDALIQNMAKAENEAVELELKTVDDDLKKEWKNDYDKNIELSKRAFKHFSDKDMGEFKAHPTLIKAFYKIGVAMGEDFSPAGSKDKGDKPALGFVYDKSPAPPK